MADVLERYNTVKQKVADKQQELATLRAKFELTEGQIREVLAEIQKKGIQPEQLSTEIARLESELTQEIDLLEKELANLPPLEPLLSNSAVR